MPLPLYHVTYTYLAQLPDGSRRASATEGDIRALNEAHATRILTTMIEGLGGTKLVVTAVTLLDDGQTDVVL